MFLNTSPNNIKNWNSLYNAIFKDFLLPQIYVHEVPESLFQKVKMFITYIRHIAPIDIDTQKCKA